MDWLSLLNPIEWIKTFTNWINRPKPDISFEYKISRDDENDYCHFRFNKSVNRESLFFRLGVNNNGKRTIEDADIRVEKIETINEDGERLKVNSSPFFLHWANENTDNSRSIYKETPVYIDILYTIKDGQYAYFFYKSKHNGSGIREFITPGKWVITIKLLGKNINPVEKEIYVDVNGDWTGLKMNMGKGKEMMKAAKNRR